MAIFDFLNNDPRRRRLAEQGLDDLPIGIAAPGEIEPPSRLPNISAPGAVTPPFAPPGPSPMPNRPDMRGALTATPAIGGIPDANTSPPVPLPRPTPDLTGMGTAMPKPQTRYGQLNEAKDVYLAGTPGRGKSALLGALGGALQGLGSGAGLGGAIGGAIAGAGYGGINPKGLREAEFNARIRPKILEGFQFEDADRAQKAAQAKAALEGAMAQANIANIQSQIDSRAADAALAGRKQTFEEGKPMSVPAGASVYKPGEKAPVFTAPERTKSPTSAELGINPDNGMSVEEEARASYEARGGDQYVFDRLPARTKQLLDKGTITGADGKEIDANAGEVAAAQRELQTAINRQWQADLSYTKGATRSKVLGRGKGGGSAPAAATSPGLPKGNPRRAAQNQRRAISVQEAADLLK